MISVLIVDDEPPMRDILVRWLKAGGYDVRDAPDAEAALARLGTSRFDVVLSDVQMPGRDGLWLVSQIRERFPDVAIVLATADDAVPPAVSLRDGIVEYLVKPLERQRVIEALDRAVAWRETAATRGANDALERDVLGAWLRGEAPKKREPERP